jgi:hypothetical protein
MSNQLLYYRRFYLQYTDTAGVDFEDGKHIFQLLL